MACTPPVNLTYPVQWYHGIRQITNFGDGYSVNLSWYKPIVMPGNWPLAFNIYWSTDQDTTFSEGIKMFFQGTVTTATILDAFKPGDVYYFAVRATAFEPGTVDLTQISTVEGAQTYPESALVVNVTDTDIYIPVQDASIFPPFGVVQIGAELIQYTSLDLLDNYLVTGGAGRGYRSEARMHTTDGYDGVRYYDNPLVQFFKGFEENNFAIGLTEVKFALQYARTNADGYRDQKDIVTSLDSLAQVEANNEGFPAYPEAGWHTNPVDLLAGKCVGSYYGGEWGCADGYDSDGPVRGLTFQDHLNMREELLLETTGEPVVLFRRMYKGKNSSMYDAARENSIHRGLDTNGTSFVIGYEQYFDTRRSDGRILVRFPPTKENIKRNEDGLENDFTAGCWTAVVPIVNDGDFIIRFNEDKITPEWRYEIIDVDRNKTVLNGQGLQKFTAVRVRKTDPIYQVRAFYDTSSFPSSIMTSIAGTPGPGGLPPHMHTIRISEKIINVSQINQTTSISHGHDHDVINGIVSDRLGHQHLIILP